MRLQIVLKKGQGKASTLTCIREDGTKTWARLHAGLEDHDLAHYALESVMNWQEAFFGLVSQGYEIGDFEKKREERPEALIPANLPWQAKLSECIVGLLQVQRLNSGESRDFIQILEEILKERNLDYPPDLTKEKLQDIREMYHRLAGQWLALAPGESLQLEFIGQ